MRCAQRLIGAKLDVMQFIAPFSAFTRQPACQFAFISVAVYMFYLAISVIRNSPHVGVSRFKAYRIDSVQGGPDFSHLFNATGLVQSFQLTRKGCQVSFHDVQSTMRNDVTFPEPVEIDGVVLTLDNTSKSEHVFRFSVQGSSDDWQTSFRVGSSDFRWTSVGVRFLDGVVDLKGQIALDFRPPWPWLLVNVFDAILFALCFLSSAVFGLLKDTLLGKKVLVFLCILLSLNSAVAGAGYASAGMTRHAFYPIIHATAYLTMAVTTSLAEGFLLDVFAVLGLYTLSARVMRDCLIFRDWTNLFSDPPVNETFCFLGGVAFVLIRRRFVVRAVAAVERHAAFYALEWRHALTAPGGRDALAELTDLAAGLARGCPPPALARQLNRRRAACAVRGRAESFKHMFDFDAAEEGSNCFSQDSLAGTVDPSLPVTSLDQLYSQALAIVGDLHDTCAQVAAAANGALAHPAPPPCVSRTSSAATGGLDPGGAGAMEDDAYLDAWAARRFIKSPARAVAKALECYGGDASRLLDVCRARIVFDNVAALAAGLRHIADGGPARVKIVRVRNFMAASHDCTYSGGFRGVIVNVRLDSQESRLLGAESHVCEIQLLLRPFAEFLDAVPERHAQFLGFRAIRKYVRRGQPLAAVNTQAVAPAHEAHTANAALTGVGDSGLLHCAVSTFPLGEPQLGGVAAMVPSVQKHDYRSSFSADALEYGKTAQPSVADASAGVQENMELSGFSFGANMPPLHSAASLTGFAWNNSDSAEPCNSEPLDKSDTGVSSIECCGTGNEGGCPNGEELASNPHRSEGAATMLVRKNSVGRWDADHDMDAVGVGEEMFLVYLKSTTKAGGILDVQASNVARAMQRSSASSVIFSSKPLTAMATRKAYLGLALLLSLFYMYLMVIGALALRNGGSFEANAARLTVLEWSGWSEDGPPPQVDGWGLMQDGCRMASPIPARAILTAAITNSAVTTDTLFFPERIRANGYYFSLPNFTVSLPLGKAGEAWGEPLRWVVEASVDNGSTWQSVGASEWRIGLDGKGYFYPQLRRVGAAGSSGAAHRIVETNHRPEWPWALQAIAYRANSAIMLAIMFLLALCGLPSLAQPLWAMMLANSSILSIAAASGYAVSGRPREAAAAALVVPSTVVAAVGVVAFEPQIALVFFSFGFLRAVSDFGQGLLYVFDPTTFVVAIATDSSLLVMLLPIVAVVLRRRILVLARRMLLEDQARYDRMWDAIAAEPAHQSAIVALQLLTADLNRRADPSGRKAAPLQLNRRLAALNAKPDPLFARSGWALVIAQAVSNVQRWLVPSRVVDDPHLDIEPVASDPVESHRVSFFRDVGIPRRPDETHPVDSLDQLYAQAQMLQPILLAKVKAWAVVCLGKFPVLGRPNDFVHLADPARGSLAPLKFGKVKSVRRAVEKAVRSYRQDVSRLVDLCRQSVVFDDMAGIVNCLKIIGEDPEVEVLRIKNRFDPGYDASESGGYRDVGLNLRVSTAETVALGLELHVCEVQLLLRPIATLKSDEGHQRYVTYRNLRGE